MRGVEWESEMQVAWARAVWLPGPRIETCTRGPGPLDSDATSLFSLGISTSPKAIPCCLELPLLELVVELVLGGHCSPCSP